MKRTRSIAVLLVLLVCAAAWAADAPTPILPAQFAGWQLTDSVTKSTDPSAADTANAPVLKEYGFQRLEKATYTRDDGRKLAIKAAVFADASGAYGAFTAAPTHISAEGGVPEEHGEIYPRSGHA